MITRRFGLFSILFLFLFSLVYNLVYAGKILPNTYVTGLNLSGKSKTAAFSSLSERFGDFERSPIVFEVNGKRLEAKPADLGITLSAGKTLDEVYKTGRSGDFALDSRQKIRSVLVKTAHSPYYRVDFDKFAVFLNTQFSNLEKQPRDASIGYQGNKLVILPEEAGLLVDKGKLTADILKMVESLDSSPVKAELASVDPRINSAGAAKALTKVQALAGAKLAFTYGYDSWSLSDNILDVLRFYPLDREKGFVAQLNLGEDTITTLEVQLADTPQPTLNVVVDENSLDEFFRNIASSVDRPTHDATLKFVNGKVSEFSPAVDGQKVDIDAAKKLVLSKVSVDDLSASGNIRLALPVAVTRARIDSNEVNSYGIRELIGRGVSYYGGSIANRVYNVGLGASRASGTIVAPGDVFSFNKAVGEVSGATGYKQAYIISGGRTVLDDGGGICQVSTTIFRAAINAGLPIVARTAHAYRVGYYEQRGFLPGLDATVWAPGVDFMFKNDTDHYILVQAVMDPNSAKLEVDIYGTGDGRRVEVTDPVVSNFKPAPAARYQDDPTLPKGIVKQVDFSAPGSDVYFTRKVFKGDKLVTSDVFKSNFRPWQAVYLVGTGG